MLQCSSRKRAFLRGCSRTQTSINLQRDVNGYISVGVRANLPPGQMRFASLLVQLRFRHNKDAVIVGSADIAVR